MSDPKGSSLFERCIMTTASGARMFILSSEVADQDGIYAIQSGNEAGVTIKDELAGLKIDLAKLEAGWVPGAADLSACPLMDDWGAFFQPGEPLWRVVGHCSDVQSLAILDVEDGQQIATMQVLAIDDELTWMRDRRGFYRLGTPG